MVQISIYNDKVEDIMPEKKFKTKHKCPEDGHALYEEETSLLNCPECRREYYTFRGKIRTLQGSSQHVDFTARN
jgi:hypothetical protein